MSPIHVLAFVTSSWAVVMALSPILQIRSIVQTRSSASVSVGYFAVLAVGFALWFAYGLAKSDLVLIVPNCVAFVLAVITITVALRYGSGDA